MACCSSYTVADGRRPIPPSLVRPDIAEYHIISGLGFLHILTNQAFKNAGYYANVHYNHLMWVLLSFVYPALVVLSMFSAVLRYARSVKRERDEVFEQELYVQKKNSLHAIGGDSEDEDLEA
jgi:hypothetical protein